MNTVSTQLIFATHNENKAKEISGLLPSHFVIKTLSEIGLNEDIPETENSIEGNALQKARYVYQKLNINCFADDTGLEIDELNGEPGVTSARYAGLQRNSEDNMQLVLERMKNIENRSARFKTVIALIVEGKEYLFEGIVNGVIRHSKSGENGFGYDPIFEPEECGRTFAEMSLEEKNQFSHRSRAIKKLTDFLKNDSINLE